MDHSIKMVCSLTLAGIFVLPVNWAVAEGLHPFVSMGGAYDKSAQLDGVQAGVATHEGSNTIKSNLINSDSFVAATNPTDQHQREYALSSEISPLATSDSFNQSDRLGEQTVDHPLGFLRLLGLDGNRSDDKKGAVTARVGVAPENVIPENLPPTKIINQYSSGGLSQSDSFHQPDIPREGNLEHSINW